MMYRGGANQSTMIPGGQLGKAKFALANGQYDEAEKLLRKRLERQGDDASARLLLAQTLLQTRRTAEALSQVRRVLRDQPKNVDALLTLASALTQGSTLRVPKEAEEAARRAVALQPKSANTHIQLAEVLAAQRDTKAARVEIEEAVRLDPRSPSAQLMRALLLQSDKDPIGAIQASDAAIRYGSKTLGPSAVAQAELVKANALTDVKRYDEALAALDSAERQNPMLAGGNSHSLRGRILFRQRKFGPSYQEFLIAQRATGRLRPIAPVLAGVNMVLSVFGRNAPFVFGIVLAAIVLGLLALVGMIPVAGPWLVVVLVLALVGFFAFSAVRYLQGSILPAGMQGKMTTIAAAIAAAIVGGALALYVEHAIATNTGNAADWFSPAILTIAGVIALVLAALAAVGWPRLLARYEGRGAARA